MGFFNHMKGIFSTGQASAVDNARRLHDVNDLEGAVNCLEEALVSRKETGKALAVIKEYHTKYFREFHQRRLTEYQAALSGISFSAANYSLVKELLASIEKGLREGVYSGETRSEAEGLYKEYQRRFQESQERAQKQKQAGIIERLNRMSSVVDADAFVSSVEELRSIGGCLPQAMLLDYQMAQEKSYILPDDLLEFDNYVIERSLGHGGFSTVFLASPKGISFQEAVKIFSPQPSLVRELNLSLPELKERFRREARIMISLSKEKVPGVVNARHADLWRGKPYLTMDYYPKNLASLIGSDDELLQSGNGGHLAYDAAFPLISQILTSIHLLHNRPEPIIHRDLKPENILLDNDNRSYIGDFGLAREVSRADLLTRAFKTVTGTNLATQYYGAPEQRGGFKEADQRADVFSLGVMIYRILTGRLIGFHDLEPIELYVKGLGKDTADKINDLLNKATKIEVGQRLSDVSTLLEIFSPDQPTIETNKVSRSVPTTEDQFFTLLELAYSFSPDGKLPENVHKTLFLKSQQLGLDLGKVEILERDFRISLGLSQDEDDGFVSTKTAAVFKTVKEKDAGTLVVTSEPEMASVFLDGIERGITPLTIDGVESGKRSIRLKLKGFFPEGRIERIIPKKETRVHSILEPQTGSIKVRAKVFSDAYPTRFYLDGKLMGSPPLVLEDITAGTHTCRLEADNHQKISRDLVVNLDKETKFNESLKPLPGVVILKSMPSDAAIWHKGKDTGEKTDHLMELPTGTHEIILKLSGYKDITKNVYIKPEGFFETKSRLKKEPHIPLTEPTFIDPVTGMEFLYIPGGKFVMGNIFGDGNEVERPVRQVELDGFYLGKYPVTQGEWFVLMGNNPSGFNKGKEYPVECLSWNDAQAFLELLTSKNNGRYNFRLPTEAEWEYAARSGGKQEKYAGCNSPDTVAWCYKNSRETSHSVGKKLPNGLGLYDMNGNVWEWCQDYWCDLYPSGAATNPKGPLAGSWRVVRGGCWNSKTKEVRSTSRYRHTPYSRVATLGFRLALTP